MRSRASGERMNAQELTTTAKLEQSELRRYLTRHVGPVLREVKRTVRDPDLRGEVVRKAIVPFHVWRRGRGRMNGR